MAVALLATMSLGPIAEALPPIYGASAVGLIVVLPVVPLALWCLAALALKPRLNWPGLLLLAAYCAAFVLGFNGLMRGAGIVDLVLHWGAYRRVVANARAGRLPLDAEGWSYGRAQGIAYAAHLQPGLSVAFSWGGSRYGEFLGLAYVEKGCPRPEPKPEPSRNAQGVGLQPPVIKHAAAFPMWHVIDHYCVVYEPGM